MTQTDKRLLFLGGLLTLLVTLFTYFGLRPEWEIFVTVIFAPVGAVQIVLATVFVAAVSAWLAMAFYRNDLDSPHTTLYYFFQSPLEETIFRFNTVLIVKSLNFSVMEVIGLGLVQALIFMFLHFKQDPTKVVKHFLLGLLWFGATYWFGIIPAMVGHITHQLALRAKIRNVQGWLYKED